MSELPKSEYKEEDHDRRYGTFVPKSGEIELIELDYAILRVLPGLGTKIGKYLPAAKTAPEIRKELDDPQLPSSVVAGRLRWLRAGGFATPVKSVGRRSGARGWQRTAEGAKLLLGEVPDEASGS